MITNLAPYPAYRDSGVPWLNEVPEHWDVRRLKAVVASVNEQITAEGGETPYIALEHIEGWTGRVRSGGAAPAGSAVKTYAPQDVLFGKLRPYLAKVARLSDPGVCVGEFLVLRPRKGGACSPYVEQLLRSKPIIDAVNASTFGAKMPRADWTFIGSMEVTLPPPDEQAAIVRFLDYADRRFRRYVRAKQRLIALLEEQKQAIIYRAVTRGLDPDLRLRPSGVEWLGDIPEHWDLVPNRTLLRPQKRLVGARHTEFTLLSLTKQGIIVRDMSTLKGKFSADMSSFNEVRSGDIVFCLFDVPETPRTVGLSQLNGMITGAYDVFEFIDPSVASYFEFYYRAMDDRKLLSPLYSGLRNTIPMDRLLSAKTPLPPPVERNQIVEWVTDQIEAVEIVAQRARQEIGLVQEYRSRLIADVVTGKLDAREAAARLPEETDAPELLADLDLPDDQLNDLDAEEAEAELAEMGT